MKCGGEGADKVWVTKEEGKRKQIFFLTYVIPHTATFSLDHTCHINQGVPVHKNHYCTTFSRLKEVIQSKLLVLLTEKVILLHLIQLPGQFHLECLAHRPYNPHLTPFQTNEEAFQRKTLLM
jgi:hypothetical protein